MRRNSMYVPIITGILLSLVMIGISLRNPNTGRIMLGIFFLVMAIGVNGTITLFNPQSYVDYSQGALLSIYRELGTNIISLNPVVFGLLLIGYEITISLLMLYKGKFVKAGMIGSILFLIAIAPVSLIQIPWLGLAITPAYLSTKNFETSFWEIMRSKFSKEK
jgi:hypothetical protein